MTAPFQTARLQPVVARAEAAPVYNALVSLALLHTIDRQPESGPVGFHADQPEQLDSWVITAARQLSTAELHTNRLLFEALGAALIPPVEPPDFPAYLAEFEAQPAEQIRDRALQPLLRGEDERVLLNDPALFLTRVAEVYPHGETDPALLREAHALLNDPTALQRLAVGHLRGLWEHLLASEWRQKVKLVGAVAGALQQRSFPTASAPTIIRAVIGRDLPADLAAQLADVRELVFVPSPHVGLYTARLTSPDTLWVFVAVSTISGWALRQGPINAREVLARITPLADATGLRILDLLAQHGELSAQELISELGISQSGVSRHLKALGGYIVERRGEGAAKRYQLSRSHLDWTLVTLRRFLEADREPEVADLAEKGRGFAPDWGRPIGPQRGVPPVNTPSDLRRFMDAQGLLTAFPTRRRDQLAVLEYLAARFEHGRDYSERDVNETIRACLSPRFDDFVTLRRELYNFGYLGRERDGSRYWRIERADQTPEPAAGA